MYVAVFEYEVSSSQSVLVRASCKDVGKCAHHLQLYYPPGFLPPRSVADDIERIAVIELKKVKHGTT